MKKILAMLGLIAVASVQVANVFAQAEDTESPTDVVNVRLTPGPASLVVEWDPAEDDEGVVDYKVYYGTRSVAEDEGWYQNETNVGSEETTYEIDGLTGGNTYYVAVTALDAAQNESMNYSLEVSGVPEEAEEEIEEIDTVVNTLPTAFIDTDVTAGEAPLEVNFDASGSSYSDGEIVSYAWDLDGDGEIDSEVVAPSYVYEESGVFDAVLIVTADDGTTAETSVNIIAWEEEQEEEVVEEEEVEETVEVEEVLPVDVSGLDFSYLALEEGYNVTLKWVEAAQANESNAKYIIEVDGENYEVNAGETEYTVFLNGGNDYLVKVYAETGDGVRSEGVQIEFTLPDLPDTGPAMLIPLGVAALFGGGSLMRRKK